jgi:intracellular sulfur oxidation DsrE/DsrF family protein
MKKNYLFKAAFLASVLCGATGAFAGNSAYNQVFPNVDETCTYPTLVLNLYAPQKYGATNSSICVDVPVALDKMHVVFNLDTNTLDGAKNSVGLKHMVFLGTAIKDRIDRGLVNPRNVEIVGILHGSAAGWATKSKGDTADLTQQHSWIDQIMQLRKDGINIQLEICGVTMRGNNWTKADLYGYEDCDSCTPAEAGAVAPLDPDNRIYVNQGAIGRIIDLEQRDFAYIHEGYEDRDAPAP